MMDVEELLARLSMEEKAALISGNDFWHTKSIPRLKIPSIRMSDGPNGVRGTRYFDGVPAGCFPCGTALAATWNTSLLQAGGVLQGQEAIAKGVSVLLCPTVNIQRSPLGGRGFESFSEDPYLAGTMAAATIRGIQSTGVAATIKHFVANDQEDDRHAADSIVSERALREIYLLPFQIAQRDSQPWAYMTAYNKVNGIHASENEWLLESVLRREWGFDGAIISDWWGTYSVAEAINAGLDVEMPGPSVWRARLVALSVAARKVTMHTLNERVRNLLKLLERVAPLNLPEYAEERMNNTPEAAAMLRKLGGDGIVLCKNANRVLPFSRLKSTAVIGPNAKVAAYCGGGSARLRPYYAVTPYEGLREQSPDIRYALGCIAYKKIPLLSSIARTPDRRHNGVEIRIYTQPAEVTDRKPVKTFVSDSSDCFLDGWTHSQVHGNLFWMEMEGLITAEADGEYIFSLSVNGTAKLYVDGAEVVDNTENQRPGDSFFGAGTAEEMATTNVKKGNIYTILVQYGTAPTSKRSKGSSQQGAGGLRVGCTRKTEKAALLDEAVELARVVDQVVLCVGTSGEWESEGYDRQNMDLPSGIDDLVSAVCQVNPNVVVVNQSGTPVSMPWAAEAPAIIQAWFGGNETGNTIADVVFGAVNPSGKMPLSWPKQVEDNPAYFNYKSENGKVLYGEGVYVGYRYYEMTKKQVLFPFGHGMSYTDFSLADLQIVDDGDDLVTVTVKVKNTGLCDGAEVVQVYVAQSASRVQRPPQELKGFKKVFISKGGSAEVSIPISKKYAASYWDEEAKAFVMEEGIFKVKVGTSSAGEKITGSFKVGKTAWWTGI